MHDFSGQTVLVTGAASGIGLGIAQAFYTAGAHVALGDFRSDALEQVRAHFPDPSRIHCQSVDVRDHHSVKHFVQDSEAVLGPVTIAVANAGIYPNTPVLEMDPEEWDRVIETNAGGAFLTCQTAARGMVQHGIEGKIVTISSGAAYSGRRGAAHYCASKAAIIMLTKVLALELAEHKITVNAVAPGLVEVNSEISPLSDEYVATLTNSIPLGRIGRPNDIAQGVLFLASPAAEFITGTVLTVDGGSSAGRASLPLSNPTPTS